MTKFIIIICIIQLFVGCHKPCNEPNYTFNVAEAFSPEVDSINIGDTLWLQSSVLKLQADTGTHKEIDFSSAENLGTNLIISDISKFTTSLRGAVDSFNFLKINGNIFSVANTDEKAVKQLTYTQTANSFELKIGIVALKAGSYIFSVPDNPSVYRKGMTKCGLGNFRILNQNNNKHLYLFENLLGPLSTYDRNHSYCIKVK
jgi:hypothetical protein